jgi:hypothetical protein
VDCLWVIDGMNVIGSRPDRWWNDPDRGRQSMPDSLGEHIEERMILVFDRRPTEFGREGI